MAATNFTPIILYHTTTASAAPTAGNLNNGELAINITDGKLFYKDNGGTVQVIATKGTGTIGGSNTQVQYNSSGALAGSANFTFNGTTATINTLNLTNALGTAYGGTALTTYTQGDLVYASAANTLAKLGIGANTYILTSTGSVPQWSAPSAVTVATANNLAGGAAGSVPYQSGASTTTFLSIGSAGQVLTSSGTAPQWSNLSSLGVTSLSFGTTGLTPNSATQGAITVAGTLATTNGGTGLTSFSANQVFYASSTSAIGQSANLTFDGTILYSGGFQSQGDARGLRLLNAGATGGGTVYANAGATAGITIGADAGPLVLQSGGLTTLTLANNQTAVFTSTVTSPYLSASPNASSNTGPVAGGLILSSTGAGSGYYSPAISFDIGGGGGGADMFTSRLGGAGGRFYLNTDATNGTSYNRLLITEDGEWYWYNNNVTTGAQAMSLTGSNLVVSGQIQSNLEDGLVSTAQNAANNGIYLQVRPYSGQSGYLTFTENGVADRWAIGIQPGDGTLYFRNAQVTGTAVAKLSSSGQLTLGNVTQYSTSALTIPANAAVSQPTFTIRDIDSLGADAYRGAGGNIQFRSATSFANNGAQGTMFLAARNYASAPGSANDSTEKVGLWIKGYYDNLGTPMPLYLGGYGYAGVDYVLQIDQNRNLGVLIDPAPWAWPNGTAGVLQLQGGAAFSGYNAGTYLSNNWYYNAGEKYIANGYATRYVQGSGGHYFYTAGNNSAGAGANLSWGTEKFSSDASGVFRINSNTGGAAGNNLIIGNGNVTANNIVTINTGDQNYAAINLSNWDGATTTYGPRIGFDNSGHGGWTIGSSDARNNFEISRSWGTPDFTVGSTGASYFGGSYSYGGAAAGVININGYGSPTIGFQAVANGALRAYIQHDITGGGYGQLKFYVGGDNNTNASTLGLYLLDTGQVLTNGATSVPSRLGQSTKLIAGAAIIRVDGSGTGAIDTNISINQLDGGATALMLASRNTGSGTSTASAVYIIRFYYDGNNAPTTTYLGGSGDFITFGTSGSNTLTITNGAGGNVSCSFFMNR